MAGVDDDLYGSELGPYRLSEPIGSGGMGTVYRAVDQRNGEVRACKVLTRRASADPALRARFASRICVIDHPHVVPICDVGLVDGRLFVAMQLVLGRTVHAVLQGGPLVPQRAMVVFGQLCSALAALHRRELMHLDVKPANVVLSAAHADDHVFLLDYGLLDARTARVDAFVGTPNYASPEHLRGQPISPASDVYSLTCFLFALLSGRPPFAGRLTEVISGQLRGRVPSLARASGLPAAIDGVIAAGLHRNPSRRPGDAEQLAADARRVLAVC